MSQLLVYYKEYGQLSGKRSEQGKQFIFLKLKFHHKYCWERSTRVSFVNIQNARSKGQRLAFLITGWMMRRSLVG